MHCFNTCAKVMIYDLWLDGLGVWERYNLFGNILLIVPTEAILASSKLYSINFLFNWYLSVSKFSIHLGIVIFHHSWHCPGQEKSGNYAITSKKKVMDKKKLFAKEKNYEINGV